MAETQMSTGKALIIVVLVAIVTAVVVSVIQELVLGKANIAVTGGIVGVMTALVILRTLKKPS
jgi:hypothetical protein